MIELETNDAYRNMAIDEAISEAIKADAAPPTIRFYRWKPSAVSIGYFQSLEDEVNIERCRQLGVNWVRRRTGAGAVYHDFNGEITYSVIAPEFYFPKGIRENYRVICQWVIDGLAELGIEASFAPINDVLAGGKKISGNAMTRRDGIQTQHGTVLYDLDIKSMFSVLKVSNEKISDKMIKSVEERVTRVLDFKDVSIQDLYFAMLKGFTNGKSYKIGKLTNEESKRADQLAKEVYASEKWNFMR